MRPRRAINLVGLRTGGEAHACSRWGIACLATLSLSLNGAIVWVPRLAGENFKIKNPNSMPLAEWIGRAHRQSQKARLKCVNRG